MLVRESASGTRPLLPFLGGLAAGLCMAALFVTAVTRSVLVTGVTVHVEAAPIVARVQSEIQAVVRQEVPATLEALKREIPARVAAQTAQRLAETRVDVGGFSIPVPPAAAAQVQAGVEQALKSGMEMAMTPDQVRSLSDRLSARASGVVQRQLQEALAGQTFPVEVFRGVTVPVHVVLD